MNKVFGIEVKTLGFFYNKYKNYLVPILTLVICFFLLIGITIPQIGLLSQRQAELKAEEEKLNILNKNYSILSNLSSSSLDSRLKLSTDALPIDKNFAAIINSINLSAEKAGVFLGDYQFTVGDLSKSTPGKTASFLEVDLSINGGAISIGKFVGELYKSLPIAEVKNIVVNNNRGQLTVDFYYRNYAPIDSNSFSPLPELTKDRIDILKEIGNYNNPSILEFPVINASSSSSPF